MAKIKKLANEAGLLKEAIRLGMENGEERWGGRVRADRFSQ
jgi:hypothetical protein